MPKMRGRYFLIANYISYSLITIIMIAIGAQINTTSRELSTELHKRDVSPEKAASLVSYTAMNGILVVMFMFVQSAMLATIHLLYYFGGIYISHDSVILPRQ